MTPREARLRRLYDIGEADYDLLLAVGKGGCWICGALPGKLRLAVDHDHKTGRIRGLLCFRCNRALKEFIGADWLAAALTYMRSTFVLEALGREPQGRVGRVTNKSRRRGRRGLTTTRKS